MPTVHDFAYTGAEQTLDVPSGVESAVLEVWGAQGGTSSGIGGPGGYVIATIEDLVPGETLYVYVGQQATSFPGGWNGGGSGQQGIANRGGMGGGGATDIRRGGNALADRILVGGGGGGGRTRDGGNGGAGGHPDGASSGSVDGGEQTGPGTAGISGQILGTFGVGGSTGGSPGDNRKSGGGGGGWWGGNSYPNAGTNYFAGGGGSSYYDPDLVDVTAETVGTWTGNGKARITLADPSNIGAVDLGPLTATATVQVSRSRRRRPRREYLWIRDLSGEQIGVIR